MIFLERNKIHTIKSLLLIALISFSCNVNQSGKVVSENLPEDSGTARQSNRGTAHADPMAAAISFTEITARFADSVFGTEYSQISPDPGDDMPQFHSSMNQLIRKFRKKKSIENEFGKGILPSPVFQAWQFRDSIEADSCLLNWLNEMEHSGEKIQPGRAVSQIKSGPLVAFIHGQTLYMIKTACIFGGTDWEQLSNRFFESMAGHCTGFEIHCGGKGLQWRKK